MTDRLTGKKILIVDDEQDILDVLEELLDSCRLAKASSFAEAKALLESEEFDLAILDIMGVDGYGLLDIANRKSIPAVMLTAHAFSPENLKRSIRQGAASYIPKEELAGIREFLNDVLKARESGEDPWRLWDRRLPSSYFERRWGSAWRDTDKEFWERFRESIRARRSATGKAS